MTPDAITDDAEVWEAALRKLRVHLMPPPDKPQPTQTQLDDFAGWLKAKLDRSASTPRAAYVPVQRLNRTEYAKSIRDLFGTRLDVNGMLPHDEDSDGFENVA